MSTATATYRIKGTNSDATTCACCGRDDLTRVVWLAPLDADENEGTADPYGSTCAARLIAPGVGRGVATQLVNISRAIAYIQKWTARGYDHSDICAEVGVRFNVWATDEGDRIAINTPTGWTEVN